MQEITERYLKEKHKQSLWVQFRSVSEVIDFVSILNDIPLSFYFLSGKYVISAKSIMGIFSANISHELELIFYTDNAKLIDSVKEKIHDYMKNEK